MTPVITDHQRCQFSGFSLLESLPLYLYINNDIKNHLKFMITLFKTNFHILSTDSFVNSCDVAEIINLQLWSGVANLGYLLYLKMYHCFQIII